MMSGLYGFTPREMVENCLIDSSDGGRGGGGGVGGGSRGGVRGGGGREMHYMLRLNTLRDYCDIPLIRIVFLHSLNI